MLKIKRASRQEQQTLFNEPDLIQIDSIAKARPRYGEAAEKIACNALGLHPIEVDGRYDVCFDAEDDEDNFYEIKSLYATSTCPLWDCRIQKDKESGVNLYYVFVTHTVRHVSDTWQMWEALSESVRGIYVIPFTIVHAVQKTKKLSGLYRGEASRNGYEREGYKDGYRCVGIKELLQGNLHYRESKQFSVYNYEFNLTVTKIL